MVSKPPEQQEKPEEVAAGTSGLSMPQLVSDDTPKKKKAKEKWLVNWGKDDETILERVE